jgi:hypothetical protein
MHIAVEGEPTQILGSWIGNQVNQVDPWTPILEKIDKSLNQWKKSHPTIFGKRIIVQMVIGGMTQFLTKAQGGMPPDVEKKLVRRICTFIWGTEVHQLAWRP